jgi:hypothetical protein
VKWEEKNLESGKVRIRLIFGPVPGPLYEGKPTAFGLQTTTQEVLPGRAEKNRTVFECELTMSIVDASTPIFSGPCANGPASSRFLYLSWKRLNNSLTPWVQRIKIPLAPITKRQALEALDAGHVLQADVTGRRPHDTTPVVWQVVEGSIL